MKTIFFLIFFICLIIRVDRSSFPKIKKLNNLNCDFEDYLEITKTILETCEKNSSDYKITLMINHKQEAILNIYAKNDIKEYILFTFNFVKLPDFLTKSSIAFKYSCLNSKVDILEKRLENILDIVKWKNPALYVMIINFLKKP